MKKLNFTGNALIGIILIFSSLLLHDLEGTKNGDKPNQKGQGNENKREKNASRYSPQGESTKHSKAMEYPAGRTTERFREQIQHSQPSAEQIGHSTLHVDHKQRQQHRRLNILVFCPSHAYNRSHVQFAASVVRILQQRHQVLFIIPITRVDDKMDAATSEELGIEYFMHENPYEMSEEEEKNAQLRYLLESRELVFYSEVWMTMLKNRTFMEKLNAAKFDVGIAEMHRGYGHAFGIFHALNLPYTVNIKNYSPRASQYDGLGLSELMVKNNYPTVDLHKSFVNGEINYNFMKQVTSELEKMPTQEKEMFEVPVNLFPGFRHPTDACKYPGRDHMFRKARYFFVNSQPQIEFDGGEVLCQAEPKLKWIGGIHMMEFGKLNAHSNTAKIFEPIAKKIAQFEQYLTVHKQAASSMDGSQSQQQKIGGLILITFGTVVDTITQLHADQFAALLDGVVHAFPHYFVIWQLTKDDQRIAELNTLPNVYSADFVPQQAILADARIKAFFSHCGRNSQLEGAFNGVPVICVPRLFDQFYNGLSMEKQRIGFQLDIECRKATDEKAKSTMEATNEALNPNGTDAKHCFTKEAIEEIIRVIITQQYEGDKSQQEESPIDLAKVRRVKQQLREADQPATVVLNAMERILNEIIANEEQAKDKI